MGALPYIGEGVVAAEVAENSPAFHAGLQPGMVVTHVGRTAVNTPKEFHAAVDNATGSVILYALADDKKNPVRTVEPGYVKLFQIQNSLQQALGLFFLLYRIRKDAVMKPKFIF